MKITFTTMIFGVGMPIMFPIACGSIAVFYICEKWYLYYLCREPPIYDDELNNGVIKTLKLAPVLMLMNGYWMLSNYQLDNNNHIFPK